MGLPFSHDQFLDVFGAYNTALWPVVILFWVVTVWLVVRWLRRADLSGRMFLGALAAQWAWSGIAYHWFFFRSINPAAALFAVLFILQATIFAWLAVAARSRAIVSLDLRGIIGGGFVLYGLAYPFIGLSLGLEYPRVPLFAVPCPTTLITAGFLLTAVDVPRLASAVPILWAFVGSTAAFALGIRADLPLLAAGLLVALDTIAPSALGARQPDTRLQSSAAAGIMSRRG